MLPVVAPVVRVTREMVIYAVAMVATSLILVPVAGLTWVYASVAAVAGAWFVAGCVRLHRRARVGAARLREMRVFRDSILYLVVLFAAVLVDPFVSSTLSVWS